MRSPAFRHPLGREGIHGEISAPMAKDAGAAVVLVGHSSGDTSLAKPMPMRKECLRVALKPVRALRGRPFSSAKRGDTERNSPATGLSQVPNLISADFMLAYEPVWAIGTGLTASAGDASAIHTVLRSELRDMIGTRANEIPILYGGSVNSANAASLLGAPEIDGLLVGGASVEAASWLSIAQI
jgi:triosephosphate isomerase